MASKTMNRALGGPLTLVVALVTLLSQRAFGQEPTPASAATELYHEGLILPAAQQPLSPDADGFIRNWLVLAPIAIVGESGATEIDRDYLKGEAAIKPKRAAVDRVEVIGGGVLFFIGRGSSATGRGAHTLLIDDPIKDAAEAASPLIRDRMWDWYTKVRAPA